MFRLLNSKRFNSPTSDFAPGPAPFLEWIAIERLVVDTEYQREIGRRGATNVIQIAEHLDWSKFAPVIVAPVEGGRLVGFWCRFLRSDRQNARQLLHSRKRYDSVK
jgi:hypothetical protein